MAGRSVDIRWIAEVLGAVAVVISLVFVGFELRENALATKAEAAHNASTALQSWYLQVGTEPGGIIFRKGMADPESLSPDEGFQFMMIMHAGLLAYQETYYLGQQGALDQALYRAMTEALLPGRRTPGFNWYWQQRKTYFSEDFQQFIESLNRDDAEPGLIYQ